MKKMLKLRNILFALVVLLGIAQFFKIDKTNPVVNSDHDFLMVEMPPQKVGEMLKNQCFDCHSNESKYPWYTDYAPVSWWIKSNINGAREELNFSEWGTYSQAKQKAKAEECLEALTEGEMPVQPYVWMHESAQYSEEDQALLKDYFKNLAGL